MAIFAICAPHRTWGRNRSAQAREAKPVRPFAGPGQRVLRKRRCALASCAASRSGQGPTYPSGGRTTRIRGAERAQTGTSRGLDYGACDSGMAGGPTKARHCRHFANGANRDRTGDLLLAKEGSPEPPRRPGLGSNGQQVLPRGVWAGIRSRPGLLKSAPLAAFSPDAPARSRTWIYRLGGGRLIHWTTRACRSRCARPAKATGARRTRQAYRPKPPRQAAPVAPRPGGA
jgi:hypothetical protein